MNPPGEANGDKPANMAEQNNQQGPAEKQDTPEDIQGFKAAANLAQINDPHAGLYRLMTAPESLASTQDDDAQVEQPGERNDSQQVLDTAQSEIKQAITERQNEIDNRTDQTITPTGRSSINAPGEFVRDMSATPEDKAKAEQAAQLARETGLQSLPHEQEAPTAERAQSDTGWAPERPTVSPYVTSTEPPLSNTTLESPTPQPPANIAEAAGTTDPARTAQEFTDTTNMFDPDTESEGFQKAVTERNNQGNPPNGEQQEVTDVNKETGEGIEIDPASADVDRTFNELQNKVRELQQLKQNSASEEEIAEKQKQVNDKLDENKEAIIRKVDAEQKAKATGQSAGIQGQPAIGEQDKNTADVRSGPDSQSESGAAEQGAEGEAQAKNPTEILQDTQANTTAAHSELQSAAEDLERLQNDPTTTHEELDEAVARHDRALEGLNEPQRLNADAEKAEEDDLLQSVDTNDPSLTEEEKQRAGTPPPVEPGKGGEQGDGPPLPPAPPPAADHLDAGVPSGKTDNGKDKDTAADGGAKPAEGDASTGEKAKTPEEQQKEAETNKKVDNLTGVAEGKLKEIRGQAVKAGDTKTVEAIDNALKHLKEDKHVKETLKKIFDISDDPANLEPWQWVAFGIANPGMTIIVFAIILAMRAIKEARAGHGHGAHEGSHAPGSASANEPQEPAADKEGVLPATGPAGSAPTVNQGESPEKAADNSPTTLTPPGSPPDNGTPQPGSEDDEPRPTGPRPPTPPTPPASPAGDGAVRPATSENTPSDSSIQTPAPAEPPVPVAPTVDTQAAVPFRVDNSQQVAKQEFSWDRKKPSIANPLVDGINVPTIPTPASEPKKGGRGIFAGLFGRGTSKPTGTNPINDAIPGNTGLRPEPA